MEDNGSKALQTLSLARKAGRVELGEEPAGAAARAGHAVLLGVAADGSDHTWRRALSFASGRDLPCVRLPFSKEELGRAIGRQELAMAAFTDPGLALSFVEALPQPERYSREAQALRTRTERVRQRQAEQKAHRRNVRLGRTRTRTGKKQD